MIQGFFLRICRVDETIEQVGAQVREEVKVVQELLRHTNSRITLDLNLFGVSKLVYVCRKV